MGTQSCAMLCRRDSRFQAHYHGVNKLWSKKCRVRVSIKGKWYIFQFTEVDMMNWVLEKGPWIIGQKHLILQKWRAEVTGSEIGLDKIPVWVILRAEGISRVASVIGNPLYMDKATANQLHLDFARICVEIEAGKDIVQEVKVDVGTGTVVGVKVVVPWLPKICKQCIKFGHDCASPSEPKEDETKQTATSFKNLHSADSNTNDTIEMHKTPSTNDTVKEQVIQEANNS